MQTRVDRQERGKGEDRLHFLDLEVVGSETVNRFIHAFWSFIH